MKVDSSKLNGNRVCHINIAPEYRGGERQTELLVRELAARDWRQRLVVRQGNALGARCRSMPNVEVVEVKGNPVAAAAAARGSALVHAHEARSIYAGWLNSLVGAVPYLFTRRVDNPLRKSRIRDAAYRRAARVVAISGAVKCEIGKRYPELHCEVLHGAHAGFETNPAEVRAIRNRHAGKTLIGHVGALDHSQKGQLTLIEAARRAARERPGLYFLLIGSGRDESRFRKAIAGLENIELVGHVDNVGDYLAALDLFAFPSLHEGMGSILLDAMQFGLPIVASNVGGIPEIVEHGENGLLVPAGDPDALYGAIQDVLDTPALAARLGEASRVRAATFTAANMARRYEEIYRSILG